MSADQEKAPSSRTWRQHALARWENEGGTLGTERYKRSGADLGQQAPLPLADAELMQLRIRVIALENLLIALLTDASERQLCIARKMAGYIAPRAGFTRHKLTVQAENHMLNLVERAARFGSGDRRD